MKTIRKVFNCELKDINEADKTLTALVSTSAEDRMGDVLEPRGADVKAFNKNPVVMFAHDYYSPPIAKSLWVKKTKDGIMSKMKFASTDFAQEIFGLYKDGFMKAFSVGFIPKESEPMEEGGSQWGPQRFLKWELLEYSAVPIPANPEALALAVSKGIITEDRKKALIEMEKAIEAEKNDEIKYYDEDGNEVELPEREFSLEDAIALLKENPEWKEEGAISGMFKTEDKGKGLEDLMAENKLLEEKIVALEKEISDLSYKLYVVGSKTQKVQPEITVDNLAEKFVGVMDGVIREAQGKID